MEAETGRKIEEMVLDILKKSDMEEATEFSIRLAASERLGIDLSDPASKHLVRTIVDSYLLSLAPQDANLQESKEQGEKKLQESKQQEQRLVQEYKEADEKLVLEIQEIMRPKKKDDSERLICQLSNRRNVLVQNFKGTTLVSLREFYIKDGKQVPGSKGISLNTEQWAAFKKSVPAIEEAIVKMDGRIRSELHGKQSGDTSNPAIVDVLHGKRIGDASNSATVDVLHGKQSGDASNSAIVDVLHGKQSGDASNSATVDVLHGKQSGDASNSAIVGDPSLEPFPIEIIRFDGKNYQFWTQQMESLLKQLKIGYVLTELCPNATLGGDASAEEIAAAKAAEKRWVNDDLMCRRNILSHLSDHLFNQYANRKMSAKELWDKLRQVYLDEEFATKRLQVKNYIEFQMADEKPVVEQVRELNNIADSIVAAGMHLDDNFHVSVIISKLPPSWKDFCIKLMREEYLPFWKLMECVQTEEESHTGVKRVDEHANSIGFHQANKGGPRGVDSRPPGMYRSKSEINAKSIPCSICGKKGHLSKNCWRRYDKQAHERKAEEAMHIPTES